MTVLDDHPLDEAAFSDEASWRVASAAGQLAGFPGVMCHLYPFPGSRQAMCGFSPLSCFMPILHHEPGLCPNGHPLCPVCYPEVILDE